MKTRTIAVLGALLAAAVVRPALAPGPPATQSRACDEARSWPTIFEGMPLVRSSLLPAEAQLASQFPGYVAAFEAGASRVIMRRVEQPTRKLHGVETCLRAGGYGVRPRPAWRHPTSGLWGVVHAAKGGRTFRVREQITTADGARTWTDVSGWYWGALRQADRGPWLAITVIEPAPASR